jgi:iron only hydrogenase large subunit-like protein
MLGALVKNYYAEKEGLNPENIVVVDIMPCTGKKKERNRAKDVDYVLTTRELAKMIKSKNIDYNNLEGEQFDSPLSNYSGAGLIFGVTGGVTEAVLRHASALLDGKNSKVDFTETRLEKGRKEVEVKCGDITLRLCIVSGLGNAKNVLDDIKSGKAHYDFVEVMACPGGCINGGGQVYVDYSKVDVDTVKKLRAEAIYNHDKGLTLRISKDNVDMQKVYDEYLGKDKEKAHKLLHWRH